MSVSDFVCEKMSVCLCQIVCVRRELLCKLNVDIV